MFPSFSFFARFFGNRHEQFSLVFYNEGQVSKFDNREQSLELLETISKDAKFLVSGSLIDYPTFAKLLGNPHWQGGIARVVVSVPTNG